MAVNNKSGKRSNAGIGPLIVCECGFEILLVSDVKSMSRAIEVHAASHGRKEKDLLKAAFEEERILAILTVQALSCAAEA